MNPPSKRLTSLDAFRGITISLMVLVNNPGSDTIYSQLQHSVWNGLTMADTVFPTFLWIAGLSLSLSLVRRLERGVPRAVLMQQVCKRAAILYFLGLLLYAIPEFDLDHLRVMGVLQRSAICYFVAASICMSTRWRGQICWTAALLAAYWMAITLIPVPSYGPGNLSMEGNLAHYIDRVVLGSHNYEETRSWDPEGLLSTLPAIATTMLGVLAGHILRVAQNLKRKTVYVSASGIALLLSGVVCTYWLPINKSIWTDSFTLVMAGIDSFFLVALLWLSEMKVARQILRPFVILGMNAITVYVSAECLEILLEELRVGGRSLHGWIFGMLFNHFSSPRDASLLFAFAFVFAMFAIAYQLHRRALYLRA